jgi:hypothetical protein
MARISGAVLLLTATIAPPQGVPGLRHYDPEQRLGEYLAALDFYLGLRRNVRAVVFAENSESDLDPLRALAERKGAADRFEALHVPRAEAVESRGAGEARIVRYAMEHSPTLQTVAPGQHVWKVTGRYILRNLQHLIDTAPDTDLYINVRRWPRLWCDTYAYAYTRDGFERYVVPGFDALVANAGPGRWGEVTMAQYVMDLIARGAPVVPRFRYEPRVAGVRGSDMIRYDSAKQRAKYATRSVARRFAPRVWI